MKIRILGDINNKHKKTRFTLAQETNNTLNILDLTIEKNAQKGNIEIAIYHKSTSNNIAINSKSRHPCYQKLTTSIDC